MTLSKNTAINKVQMLVAHGASDTKKHELNATYGGISLREISQLVMRPQAVEKRSASFIIASEYRASDGREHQAQRERGIFWMLVVDVDSGNPTLAEVATAVQEVCGNCAMLIYSSASSTAEARKWRVLIPLAQAISGQLYVRMQLALFEALALFGITADGALARAGQPVFLPNVPPERRGEDGEPLFYQFERDAGEGYFDCTKSVLQERVDAIIQWEAETERQAKIDRAARMAEREARAKKNGSSKKNPVDVFNASHSIGDLLAIYGYERLGSSTQYKSRYQSSGSYATKDYGTHWVSLSGSDAAAGLGSSKSIGDKAYAWGDAFDLFVHYDHKGDFTAAVRAYGEEIDPRTPDPFTSPTDASAMPESAGLDDFTFTDATITREIVGLPEQEEAHAGIPDAAAGPTFPTPYTMFDGASLRPRDWIYGKHYLRSFVSVLASAGGIGKTSLQIVEALCICTGRPLLGETVHKRTRVYLVNLEDPMDEMQRRVLAAMKYYGIKREEVEGWLFLDAGRDFNMKFTALVRGEVVINEALIQHMQAKIIEHDIGLTFIDPWVGANDINENDNGQMNKAVAQVRRIADVTNSGICLVHHIRKTGGEDANIDSVRGAGSLIGAARAARVINRVSVEDAVKMGVPEDQATGIFRIDDGKANLAPPSARSVYCRMIGVQIDNGEWVGVTVPFVMPDAFDGVTARHAMTVQKMVGNAADPLREDVRAKNWIGHIVADVLNLDVDRAEDKARIKSIVRKWIDTDVLRREMVPDIRHGRDVAAIIVGVWINGDEASR
jgi:hypothetical protein